MSVLGRRWRLYTRALILSALFRAGIKILRGKVLNLLAHNKPLSDNYSLIQRKANVYFEEMS